MGYFVIFIFILFCLTQPVEVEGFPESFRRCLRNWRVFREHETEPGAFLTDQTLLEEICSNTTGKSVREMDRCVQQHIDQSQDNVLAYWAGIRNKYHHICQHFQDFLRYKHCRTNRNVVDAYNTCPTRFRSATCRDFQQRIICVQTSLKKHCQEEAIQFFTLLVETEFDPLMKYINCNFPSDIYLLADSPRSTFPPKSTTEVARKHRHALESIREEVVFETKVVVEDLSVYSVSSKSVSNVYVILAAMCLTFCSQLMAEYFV